MKETEDRFIGDFSKHTWIHFITVKIRTALTATNAGERGNGVPIAVAVTWK